MTIPWRNCRNHCLDQSPERVSAYRRIGVPRVGVSPCEGLRRASPGASVNAVIAAIAGLSDKAFRFTRHSLPEFQTMGRSREFQTMERSGRTSRNEARFVKQI